MRSGQLAGDDLYVRPQRANRAGDAAGKAAAAEGDEYGFDCGRLREYCEPDRGIAGQGSRIPHRIDVQAFLALEGAVPDRLPPFLDGAYVDARSQPPQLLELGLRCIHGHDRGRGDSEPARHMGDPERAVARASGIDPAAQAGRRPREDGVADGPDLERSDGLQVLEFQQNGLARRSSAAADDGRHNAQAFEARPSGFDLRHRHRLYFVEHLVYFSAAAPT